MKNTTHITKLFLFLEKLASFIAASDFERISGKTIPLKAGEYQTVTTTDF